MIVPEESYGWGILSLPVGRTPGCGTNGSAWPGFLFSGLATFCVLMGILIYQDFAPPASMQAAQPVEISYQLPPIQETDQPKPASKQPLTIVRQPEASKAASPVPKKPLAIRPPTPSRPHPVAPATPPAAAKLARSADSPKAAEVDNRRQAERHLSPPEIALGTAPARRQRPEKMVELQRRLAPERITLGGTAPDTAVPQTTIPGPALRQQEKTAMPQQQSSFHPPAPPAADIDLPAQTTNSRPNRTAAPLAPTPETATIRFKAQKEVSLVTPALKKAKAPDPANTVEKESLSFAFLDHIAPAELDRAHLVNLSQLHTCRDPGAEIALKTRLATLLSRPDLCRTGGVIYEVLHPESAYSVHLDLYNYERREFTDRCAALRQVVECFEARR